MAKIKLTRPELKRHRDALQRFQRYLPMLKLKQQQLQMMVRNVGVEMRSAADAVRSAREKFEPYKRILTDRAGVDLRRLSQADDVRIHSENIAGVEVPVFEDVDFPPADYSLFSTPAWVDGTLADMKNLSLEQAKLDVLKEEHKLLQKELTKVVQRVNMFEKVKIPEASEAIRRIRIRLGDEMTAAVGRAKIAKGKLTREEATVYSSAEVPGMSQEESRP